LPAIFSPPRHGDDFMKSAPRKSNVASRKRAGVAAPADRSGSAVTGRLQASAPTKEKPGVQWTFLTNHSHVLVLLARNPTLVLREVAQQVGITERAVQRIIAELEADGFVEREKVGRQNHYRIHPNKPLRHPIENHRTIGDLLSLLCQNQ
jgi:hypothetical protein